MGFVSTMTCVGSSIGIPIILTLYVKPHIISMATFSAVNSDTKLEVLMLLCFLLDHKIGDLLMKTRIPVVDLHVSLSPA